MIYGLIIHSLKEEKIFPVFYSCFFNNEGNNNYRFKREQAVASLVVKEYSFRAFCNSYSQKYNDKISQNEIESFNNHENEYPNLLHSDYNLDNESQLNIKLENISQLEILQNKSIKHLGSSKIANGMCIIENKTLFSSQMKIIWRKEENLCVSLVVEKYDNFDTYLRFIKFFTGLIKEEISSNALINPKELINKPDEITILVQTFIPNGYLQSLCNTHLKYLQSKATLLKNK